MARTKASVGAKVSSGKSSKARCSAAPAASAGSSGGGSSKGGGLSSGGGNPVCPRETPKWQRPITNFFINKEAPAEVDVENGGDDGSPEKRETRKPKRNIIQSDDEEEASSPPKNRELDESINLEPLDGENSHKIEEYYPKNGPKGKGIGKKTANKENLSENNRRLSAKRDLEDIAFGEEPEQASKRIKVN
ncbi:PCNA-associated factor [Plutella xylostella]|uniref:PCNA-associated factor n=1 Tax=Plutella xylostella TaxID=51655 RepID=UPI002032A36A|nr:PCNA-associated factor [Plutella xylostella]